MKEYVFLSEFGNDNKDGLSELEAVRTAVRAIAIADQTGRGIQVLGTWEAMGRLSAALYREKKNQISERRLWITLPGSSSSQSLCF
jgi:hypothetical protein